MTTTSRLLLVSFTLALTGAIITPLKLSQVRAGIGTTIAGVRPSP